MFVYGELAPTANLVANKDSGKSQVLPRMFFNQRYVAFRRKLIANQIIIQ
jgi:hypothetical protein